MGRINENIAYAKSILNKSGISPDSEEYQDYLKIREICGTNNGYVGILTKIRFVDEVTDMDEIESIFNVLKNSKIDINKLNKMSYAEILDVFYDQFSDKGDNTDLELIYKDSEYSYYRVYTHKGILKIGSPSWCLKTKSHWDSYTSRYPHQWVVVSNRYVKNIITPENNYLKQYNSKKGWIRYGISLNPTDWSYTAFTDNNESLRHGVGNYTFFGVLFTILNLEMGYMYSYWYELPGCDHVTGSKTWQKVVDRERFCHNLNLPNDYFNGDGRGEKEVYVFCSETYSAIPGILVLENTLPKILYPIKSGDLFKNKKFADLTGVVVRKLIDDFAFKSNDPLYYGIKLINNKVKMKDIESDSSFVAKVGKWLIFDSRKDFYQIVNTEMKGYEVPFYTLSNFSFGMENPMYFYIKKSDYSVYNTDDVYHTKYSNEVISFLKDLNNSEEEPVVEPVVEPTKPTEPEKKVKGFWDFLKRRNK